MLPSLPRPTVAVMKGPDTTRPTRDSGRRCPGFLSLSIDVSASRSVRRHPQKQKKAPQPYRVSHPLVCATKAVVVTGTGWLSDGDYSGDETAAGACKTQTHKGLTRLPNNNNRGRATRGNRFETTRDIFDTQDKKKARHFPLFSLCSSRLWCVQSTSDCVFRHRGERSS